MLYHKKEIIMKLKKLFKIIKYQRQIRELVSSQLTILENTHEFACGGLSDEEEAGLSELMEQVRQSEAGEIVEFGTLFGVTTLLLASLKAAGQKIITVDNFCWNPFGLRPEQHQVFTTRLLRYAIAAGDIELMVCDSAEFRGKFNGLVPAMVFFDADHSYEAVKDEIEWAKNLGIGVIAGHDYGHSDFGVTQAVDEAFPQGVNVRESVWWYKQ